MYGRLPPRARSSRAGLLQFSPTQARRLAVGAQLLSAPQPTDLVATTSHLGAIQIDPTNAVALPSGSCCGAGSAATTSTPLSGRRSMTASCSSTGCIWCRGRLPAAPGHDAPLPRRDDRARPLHPFVARGEPRVPQVRAAHPPRARASAVAGHRGPRAGTVEHRRLERRQERREDARHPLGAGSDRSSARRQRAHLGPRRARRARRPPTAAAGRGGPRRSSTAARAFGVARPGELVRSRPPARCSGPCRAVDGARARRRHRRPAAARGTRTAPLSRPVSSAHHVLTPFDRLIHDRVRTRGCSGSTTGSRSTCRGPARVRLLRAAGAGRRPAGRPHRSALRPGRPDADRQGRGCRAGRTGRAGEPLRPRSPTWRPGSARKPCELPETLPGHGREPSGQGRRERHRRCSSSTSRTRYFDHPATDRPRGGWPRSAGCSTPPELRARRSSTREHADPDDGPLGAPPAGRSTRRPPRAGRAGGRQAVRRRVLGDGPGGHAAQAGTSAGS